MLCLKCCNESTNSYKTYHKCLKDYQNFIVSINTTQTTILWNSPHFLQLPLNANVSKLPMTNTNTLTKLPSIFAEIKKKTKNKNHLKQSPVTQSKLTDFSRTISPYRYVWCRSHFDTKVTKPKNKLSENC